MKKIYAKILVTLFLVAIMVGGYGIGFGTAILKKGHCVDGFYFRNQSRPQFYRGDWICINVEDMGYERALEVCRHEVFHEIWAECGESNKLEECINMYKEHLGENGTL